MIDIHCHILNDVDDGCSGVEQSLNLIRSGVAQGVTEFILTPHKRGEYKRSPEELLCAFEALKRRVEEENIPAKLYLGQELFVGRNLKKVIAEGGILTLNGSKYLLVEFSFDEDCDIPDTVYELGRLGYKAVVAHVERYSYASLADVQEIKALGGYIQVNADAILGKQGFTVKRRVKRLFREGLVDFVASDVHSFREYDMKRAYHRVEKKFGEQVAQSVFRTNALDIIKG